MNLPRCLFSLHTTPPPPPPLLLSFSLSTLHRVSDITMHSTCLICNRTSQQLGSGVSFHRFPPKSQAVQCKQWLLALNLMWLTTTEFVPNIFPMVIVPNCQHVSWEAVQENSGQPDGKELQREKALVKVLVQVVQVLNVIYSIVQVPQ